MEQLFGKQADLGKELERLFTNFKKDSASRKTKAYLEERLGKIEEIWSELVVNHQQLRAVETIQSDHPYFNNQFFGNAKAIYEQFKEKINDLLKKNEVAAETDDKEHNLVTTPKVTEVGINEEGSSAVTKLIRRQKTLMKAIAYDLQDIEAGADVAKSKAYYRVKIEMLQQYQRDMLNNHQGISEVCETEPIEYETKYYQDLSTWLQNTIIWLHEQLDKGHNTIPINQERPSMQVKLPKINIPKFDGNYLNWLQFRDLYTQLVHNQSIDNAQKMFYLTNNLSGEARRLIQHLPSSNENYQAAWDILCNRYDNKRLLVNELLKRFFNQPVLHQESSTGIKTLHDTTTECVMGLKRLGISIETWDPILIYILLKKLDKNTLSLYEQSVCTPRALNPLKNLLEFLETRFQSLEAMSSKPRGHSSTTTLMGTSNKTHCSCKQQHPLFRCETFKTKPFKERWDIVRKQNLCFNCLQAGHTVVNCKNRMCTKCGRKHHTLLHSENSVGENKNESVNLAASCKTTTNNYVLLSTIKVKVVASTGAHIDCRAIIDSGSQTNFITQTLAKKLGLPETEETMFIQGLGNGTQTANRKVTMLIKSNTSGFEMQLSAYILPQITRYHPTTVLQSQEWNIPKNIQLADPEFHQPSKIDILIGAEKFFELLNIGQIKLGNNLPVLQNTVFGWVISGAVRQQEEQSVFCGICTQEEANLQDQMEKFWALEEVGNHTKVLSKEHTRCENFFNQTTQTDKSGRFVVRLPFNQSVTTLGNSKDMAVSRLQAMERKFRRNGNLKRQYKEFMDEYLRLNHMREITSHEVPDSGYFLPHHCVIKLDSTTTKLRVVFDASAKTRNGTSLNDILHTGPKVQSDLFSVLLKFRLPKYVFTADIEKMYRQILIHPDDRKYQLVVWRDTEEQPIRYFELQTVTYGLTSAPYLAIKCLHKLAEKNKIQYPMGAKCIMENFYVDDVMAGDDNLNEALSKKEQLDTILRSAGFKLRKWCVNHATLWQGTAVEDRSSHLEVYDDDQYHIKTLGLRWFPKADEFVITVNNQESNTTVTKRKILAEIAHLFDPLGLLNPVVVTAKLILQRLWELKLDWDAAVPMDVHSSWMKFRAELKWLKDIHIPRHIYNNHLPTSVQLHAFCDASEQAYGTAIYIRSTLADGTIIMRLLCAKSRLAPLKKVTVPRLELCAAKLGAELVHRIKQDLHWNAPCHYWTDSMIVLSWINSTSSIYHTFVANRIASIQELSSSDQWHYVASKENPADILSRGTSPSKLKDNNLWFYGPLFLYGPEHRWNAVQMIIETDLEKKPSKTTLTISTVPSISLHDINHRNSFGKLQRIMAYVYRFSQNRISPTQGHLQVKELDAALGIIIKLVQQQEFSEDYAHLEREGSVNSRSPLASLTPFLDEKGVMRVGGRLEKANLAYDVKHPMLIPYGHFVTKLIFTELHEQNAHVGSQTLLALSRQRFWAIKGKAIARLTVQNCIRCYKAKPQLMSQMMGNLPAARIQPARPFVNSGVDFCGPFSVHGKGRGSRTTKVYVAIFCCFPTKAVHIEVVSDLTTEAFIGALKRFIARRGHCRNLYCDNATNFVGANNQLKELQQTIYNDKAQETISKFCGTHNIDFHFIPPRAPHFGGLWEAAVKSAKHLFKRSITEAALTYEELTTVMAEIEAILNSRPLTPLSTDPNDLSALTPGHFLVGEPLTNVVDAHAQPVKGNLLYRWKLVSTLQREFWERWTKEYLSELQHRHKWKQQQGNAKPGMMVLLKEDNVPVLSWPLGRIVDVIHGADGLVRVAHVKTASGIFKRPISRLAPLPIESTVVEEYNPIGGTQQVGKRPAAESITDDEEVSPEQNKEDSKPNKRRRKRVNTGMGVFLTTCLLLPALIMAQTSIKPFTTQPGLYFEHIGLTKLITDEWKLIVYLNMSRYWDGYSHITRGIAQLETICLKLRDIRTCSLTMHEFNNTMAEIQNNNELLVFHRRYKRSPLDIVGNVANALFGVLDESYAERMTETIKNIDGNQQHLLELLKNQTSIIDSTVNIFNQSQDAMKLQMERFNQHIEIVQSEYKDTRIMESFNALATQLILAVNHYRQMQNVLLDVVTDTHHGKLNPMVLTPRQLQQQLFTIKQHLSPTTQLPALTENLLAFYRLMSVEGYIATDCIIFRLRLPLVSMETFELLHLTSVPMKINNTFVKIRPSSNYILVNLHRDLYYPITNTDLEKCRLCANSTYLCIQRYPLYKEGSAVGACEMGILTQTKIPHTCLLTSPAESTSWIPLYQSNRWIYTMNDTTTVTILCGQNVTQHVLTGSGILELASGCILRDKTTTIQARSEHVNSIRTSFLTSINFTNLIQQTNLLPESTSEPIILPDITELKQRIHNLKDHERLVNIGQRNDVHHFFLGYTTLGILLLVIVYIIQHKFRQYKKKSFKPTPPPRLNPERFELGQSNNS